MGLFPASVKRYVVDFLEKCEHTTCRCDSEHNACGFPHEPCGYRLTGKQQEPWPEHLTIPRSRVKYLCFCPMALTDTERHYLYILADYNGELYYSIDRIARLMGKSHRQITRVIAALERRGVVQSLTCKQAHCGKKHITRHVQLSPRLPGMLSFDALYGEDTKVKGR